MASQPAVRLLTVAAALALLGGCSGGNFDLARPAEGDSAPADAALAEVEVEVGADVEASAPDADAGSEALGEDADVTPDAAPDTSPDAAPDTHSSDAGAVDAASDLGEVGDAGGAVTFVVPQSDAGDIRSTSFCVVNNKIQATRTIPGGFGFVPTKLTGKLVFDNTLTAPGAWVVVTVYVNGYSAGSFKMYQTTGTSFTFSLPVPVAGLSAASTSFTVIYKVTDELTAGGCFWPKDDVSTVTFSR